MMRFDQFSEGTLQNVHKMKTEFLRGLAFEREIIILHLDHFQDLYVFVISLHDRSFVQS